MNKYVKKKPTYLIFFIEKKSYLWRNVNQIDSYQRKEVAIGLFPTVIMHESNIFPALLGHHMISGHMDIAFSSEIQCWKRETNESHQKSLSLSLSPVKENLWTIHRILFSYIHDRRQEMLVLGLYFLIGLRWSIADGFISPTQGPHCSSCTSKPTTGPFQRPYFKHGNVWQRNQNSTYVPIKE